MSGIFIYTVVCEALSSFHRTCISMSSFFSGDHGRQISSLHAHAAFPASVLRSCELRGFRADVARVPLRVTIQLWLQRRFSFVRSSLYRCKVHSCFEVDDLSIAAVRSFLALDIAELLHYACVWLQVWQEVEKDALIRGSLTHCVF